MLHPRRGCTLGVALSFAWATGVAGAALDTSDQKISEARTAAESPAAVERPATGADGEVRLEELVVEAPTPRSAASADEVGARELAVRPHHTIAQILNNVPGLVVAQHQGGSKAPQWFLRGFDADHGTDVAVSVDGLPVNLVTHAHGQGYADPNFLIPEVVERIRVTKGPYLPQVGDFGTAGAVEFVTRERFAERFLLSEGGSFGTMRHVLGASPDLGPVRTLLAAQVYTTDGPFEHPENLWRYNGYAKLALEPTPRSQLLLAAAGYQADWDGSGQIPLRLVNDGTLDRFGSLDPTEGGRTDRQLVDLHWRFTPSASDTVEAQVYGSRYKLRLWSDFTFFSTTGLRFVQYPNGGIEDTRDEAVRAGAHYVPGDGIYQGDSRVYWGAKARYRRSWFVSGLPLQSELGVETRHDDVHVTLRRQVRRQSFFTVNDVYVRERSVSGYLAQQIFFTDWLRLEGGLRGDVFLFDVNDRLPSQGADPNFAAVYLNGRVTDGLVSPKANLIVTPRPDTEVFLNFGRGFHSNDARAAIGGPAFTGVSRPGTGAPEEAVTPLTRALGAELGSRTQALDRVDLAAAIWLLDLDSELVFSGDAGTDEPSGPSRRWGIDFATRWEIARWLAADYDLAWADPRFRDGGAIPLAPTLLMQGGLTAEPVRGLSVGLRARYLADRPANAERTLTAQGYFLLDLVGRYRWRNLELSLELLNLTNTDWREAQFADNSCVRREEQSADPSAPCFAKPGRSAVTPPDGIHFTPGNPFNVRAGLTVFF
jgi:outer membrane receptor protein involved in Fe transport